VVPETLVKACEFVGGRHGDVKLIGDLRRWPLQLFADILFDLLTGLKFLVILLEISQEFLRVRHDDSYVTTGNC
jgi:hypothetical protein